MQKAPKETSLTREWVYALLPAGVFVYMVHNLGFPIGNLPAYLGGLCLTTAGLLAYKPKPRIEGRLRQAFKYSSLYTTSGEGKINYPILRGKEGVKNGVRLKYGLPIGMCVSDFIGQWERLEQAVNGEINFQNVKGGILMEVLFGELPEERGFYFPDFPDYQLGIPIGFSRTGLITADLAEMPHLLVAGQTYGGKSVFLHGAVACLLRNPTVDLFLIDLARAEFSYVKDHADFSYTVEDSVKTLSFLHTEMEERLNILDRYKIEKIQNYPHDDLPYLVLVVDEFSALSPSLIKDRKNPEKKLRDECHFLLTDLLSRARKVGIHIILSTQRPDKDVLPGILKANIPATICFKVRNRVNSEICLDHGRAAMLPDIKGRAIWQFQEEREVQVMHLSPTQARSLLPSSPKKSANSLFENGEF